jgi:putative intracellular protease/amidase
MKHLILAAVRAVLPIINAAADTTAKQSPPSDGMIKVAVVLSDHATVIDFAGPWEVFQDTMLRDDHGKMIMPYKLYTVAASKKPIHTTGANRPGLTITPDYSFADVPTPDIVVVGAQSGGPALIQWLKKIHAEHETIMSVCTGAFQLAKTGLLNGKKATTHHWFFGNFARDFPKVKLVKQVRYVQAGPTLFTSGGLSSGIDLALHLVADRFGQKVAQQTADYMEYIGTGWKTNQGISVSTTPVRHQDWSGKLPSGAGITLDILIRGASPTIITTNIPAWNVADAPTSIKQKGKKLNFSFPIAGHPSTFAGQVTGEGPNTRVTGTLVRDSKSYPLTLRKRSDAKAAKADSSISGR